MKATGGGKLTDFEKRIVESPLYSDIVLKLGIAITGNESRFDSDHVPGTDIAPPTTRLQRIMSTDHCSSNNEDVEMLSNAASLPSLFDEDNFFETSTATETSERCNSPRASTAITQSQTRRSGSPVASTSTAHLSEDRPVSVPPSKTPAKVSRRRVTFDSTARKRSSGADSEDIAVKRSKRDLQEDNMQKLNENLMKQQENYSLQEEYWKLQVKRAEEALHREKLETQLVQINLQKATELKAIETNKQKSLAKMEIEVKRREYNLPPSFFDHDSEML